MKVGGSIADDKVVGIKSAIDCRIQGFNNIIDFYGEESNGYDASLWNAFLLILQVKKVDSTCTLKVSMEEKVFLKKSGRLPLKFTSCKPLMTPYFQVVSYSPGRKNCRQMLLFDEGFLVDQIVYGFSLFTESCLEVVN